MRKFWNDWYLLIIPAILYTGYFIFGFIPTKTTIGAVDVSSAQGSAEVKIITLEDNTKCAILVGYNKGAIDCNWK